MKFTKMHGCGNDYIYVNGFAEQIAADRKPALCAGSATGILESAGTA